MPEFIPGIQLNEAYYWEAVRPILDAKLPGLRHAAALIGYGSDVLGYDTPVSRDHMWGPRLLLFLPEESFQSTLPVVDEALRQNLPVRFRGYSTHFSQPNEADGGVRIATSIEQGPVNHLIFVRTLTQFWEQELGVSPFLDPDPADWLTFAEHRLLSLTTGKVYFDSIGLEIARVRFEYYPRDVWVYLLAAQWQLLSQVEDFVGRASSVGDELGSRLITAQIVGILMRLCFLMEKRYPPYAKWYGTAFQGLRCYPDIGPLLAGALGANTYPEREVFLVQAYTLTAGLHNALQITPPVDPRTRTYLGWHRLRAGVAELASDDPRNTRPHQVIFAGRFEEALHAAIHDPRVLSLDPYLGSVNQFLVESSDALQSVDFCRKLKDDLSA
jgi:hypothetical protein